MERGTAHGTVELCQERATCSKTSGGEGIERNKNYESIVTIGMRGDSDTPMSEGGQHRPAGKNRGRPARNHRASK